MLEEVTTVGKLVSRACKQLTLEQINVQHESSPYTSAPCGYQNLKTYCVLLHLIKYDGGLAKGPAN